MTTIEAVLERRNQWAVLQGDCRALLAQVAEVDHVITDPPYSEHVHGKQRRVLSGEGGAHVGFAPLGFSSLAADTRAACAVEFGRLVKRWVLVFSDAESVGDWRTALVAEGLKHVRVGAWVKVNGQPQLSGDRPAVGFEAVEIAHGPTKCAWNGGGHPAVWHHAVATDRNGTGERVHTTQKPLDLMLALVEQFTSPGDLVLDPFCGSGTTGVACLRLGRRFLGFELDAAYAKVAADRLDAESRGLSLPAARAGQISLLEALEQVKRVEQAQTRLENVLRGNTISPEKRQRVVKLKAEGLPMSTIAERLGVHRNTVFKHLKRAGQVTPKQCSSCGRAIRGTDPRCYVCRGYRISKTRDAGSPRRSHTSW